MDQVIERLSVEKKALEDAYYNHGRRAGVEFSRDASYPELSFVANRYQTARDIRCFVDTRVHNIFDIDRFGLGEYFEQILLPDGDDPNIFMIDEEPSAALIAWEEGWRDSIRDFWLLVEDKLR